MTESFTLDELAGLWKVSKATLDRHIRSGRLRASNFGTRSHAESRVSKEDAIAFRDENVHKVVKNPMKRRSSRKIVDYLS